MLLLDYFDCDDVGIVCCDDIIGWIMEESWRNSQQTSLFLKCLDWFWDAPSHIFSWCWRSVPRG